MNFHRLFLARMDRDSITRACQTSLVLLRCLTNRHGKAWWASQRLMTHLTLSASYTAVLSCSEEDENLLDVAFDVLDFLADDVEADGLGEGAALADSHDITSLDTESGRAVDRHGLMALLEPVVLLDVMQVIASDNDGPRHFAIDDNTPNQKRKSAMSMIDDIIINK